MEWKEVKIGDVAEYISKKIDTNMINLENYISTENMLPNKEGITLASSLPSTKKVNSFITGDTLFSNIRTYFKKVWFASFDGGVSNDVLVIKSKNYEVLFDKFLYYVVSNDKFIDYTVSTSKGTKMPRGDKNAIMNYKFKLPPLPIQKKIAHILSTLDEKTELNRKMNETLEAMAQAIFKSWFVDFDPVHAKAGAKTKADLETEAKKLGITPEILELFPSEFEESELGMIPKGWEIVKVHDLLELKYGKALKKTDRIPGNIPVYGSGGVIGYHNIHLVKETTIIVGRKGTVGSVYWVDNESFPIDTVFYVQTNGTSLVFCYYMLKKLKLHDMNTDAAVPGLNRNNVYRLLSIFPSENVLNFFDEQVSYLKKVQYSLRKEIQTLQKTRDTLLPKLLSGELDVSEVEI